VAIFLKITSQLRCRCGLTSTIYALGAG
jgi:hypothetical protein